MGYSPWGHKRVGHDLATKQQKYCTLSYTVSHLSSTPVNHSTEVLYIAHACDEAERDGEEGKRLPGKWVHLNTDCSSV